MWVLPLLLVAPCTQLSLCVRVQCLCPQAEGPRRIGSMPYGSWLGARAQHSPSSTTLGEWLQVQGSERGWVGETGSCGGSPRPVPGSGEGRMRDTQGELTVLCFCECELPQGKTVPGPSPVALCRLFASPSPLPQPLPSPPGWGCWLLTEQTSPGKDSVDELLCNGPEKLGHAAHPPTWEGEGRLVPDLLHSASSGLRLLPTTSPYHGHLLQGLSLPLFPAFLKGRSVSEMSRQTLVMLVRLASQGVSRAGHPVRSACRKVPGNWADTAE